MFPHTLAGVFLLLVLPALLVNGYYIDNSCRRAGIYIKVDAAAQSAIDMARIGVNALRNGYYQMPHGANINPPRDPALQRLIENIFAHDDIIQGTTPNVANPTQFTYHMTMANLRLNYVYARLNDIVNNIGIRRATFPTSFNDAVIYCDGGRLEFSKSRLTFKDKDRGNMISGNAFDAMTRCAGRGPVRREYTTKAITLGKPVDTVTGTQWPASIQLCQVTVDNVRKGIYDYYGAYREHSWIFAGKVNKKLLQWNKYGFRQIDAWEQLDVTLLHEMTHAHGAGNLNDVAYQWDDIKKLAKTGPYVDSSKPNSADHNSDSVAYFALGCKLMSDPNMPMEIQSDGTLTRLPGPVVF